MGFLVRKGLHPEVCTDLTCSMGAVGNNTAVKLAKRVGLNRPHDSQENGNYVSNRCVH